ncbi:hypothetical protein OF83DRAFT_717743 [Amylostereum chailletii]|nr:hypothetical protein OF83DRAFT_717743 [Amylostereum chailletii]
MDKWMAVTRAIICSSPLLSKEDCPGSTIHELLEFTLPLSLVEIDAAVHKEWPFVESFIKKVQELKGSIVVAKDDPCNTMFFLPSLANTFDICEQWQDSPANEATKSHPVVSLLNLAFRRKGRKGSLRIAREVDIRLAASDSGFPDKARLDFCSLCESISLRRATLLGICKIPFDALADACWQADPSGAFAISLMHFPGEGKPIQHVDNKNQLIYDLSTCLHQQESLGLPPTENFGFVFAEGVMQIYGMTKLTKNADSWYELQNYKFATFNVWQPLDFLKLYSFLCKLADHLDATLLKDFLDLQPETLKTNLASQRKKCGSWRADNKSGDSQNLGWGGGGGDGMGGGGCGRGGSGGAGPSATRGSKRYSSMPPPPTLKKPKTGGSEAESVGSYEADPFSPVPEFGDIPPDDGWPHEHAPPSTFLHTPQSHWEARLQPHNNAYVPLSPGAGDVCQKTKDEPVGQPSPPLSVNNLEAHTKREGSIDILSHTGMSTSSQS